MHCVHRAVIMRGMEQTRHTLHFIDADSRARAEIARLAFSLGYHAEVYSDIDELVSHPPRSGIIIARDDAVNLAGNVIALLDDMSEAAIWLPLIAVAINPSVNRVVEAIKAGALDYLPLPLEQSRLVTALARVEKEAVLQAEARRRMLDARSRIANLSQREREALDWLAQGSSNKTIARALDISPRTVEIHRANMMDKLGAKHSVEAVRLRLDAELERERGSGAA